MARLFLLTSVREGGTRAVRVRCAGCAWRSLLRSHAVMSAGDVRLGIRTVRGIAAREPMAPTRVVRHLNGNASLRTRRRLERVISSHRNRPRTELHLAYLNAHTNGVYLVFRGSIWLFGHLRHPSKFSEKNFPRFRFFEETLAQILRVKRQNVHSSS